MAAGRVAALVWFALPAEAAHHVGRRTLGVDYGFRCTGVAISAGYSPAPYTVLETENNGTDARRSLVRDIMAIAKREACVQVVVGMPLDAQGRERNDQAPATRAFAEELATAAQAHGLPVFLWDERGSTLAARQRTRSALSRRYRELERVDAVAAAVILESFFDADGEGAVAILKLPAGPGTQATRRGHGAGAGPSFADWRRRAMRRAQRQREGTLGGTVGGARPGEGGETGSGGREGEACSDASSE